ncbi:uncharacterized protein LOC134443536, partial [Engraulis encrasicolus]|uniref:uncharacterized protein LOC134443536 n=1 Tax=Engraulis encrasicolus TaxID=184585 RepID=UPI002FD31104
MWAEGDFPPQGPPRLESVTEPGENGTYLMYHGTSKAAAAAIQVQGFRQSEDGMLGRGVYLSRNLQKASKYPLNLPDHEKAVLRVWVNVGKVIVINYQGHPLQKTWHDYGYDTAWVPPNCGMVPSGLEEDCVWNPNRIRVMNIIYPMLAQQGWPGAPAFYLYPPYSNPGLPVLSQQGWSSASAFYPAPFPQPVQPPLLKSKAHKGHSKYSHLLSQGKALSQDYVHLDLCRKLLIKYGINMWAEDDFLPTDRPRLSSFEPPCDQEVYTMYHGTSREASFAIMMSGFRQSSGGMLGRGVYLSRDFRKANRYPLELPESQRAVIQVKVRVGRVKKIDCQGHPLQKTWHAHGYDTAWVPPNCGMVQSGLEEDCVWDPDRIQVIRSVFPSADSYSDPDPDSQQEINMWAEDDFLPPDRPRLSSFERPRDHGVYTMYHGTSREAAKGIQRSGFRQSSGGMLGRGVYLSRDLQKACRYPLELPESQRVVIKVKVRVGRVKKIDCQGHPLQKTWHDHGYDTAWVPPNCGMVKSGLEEDCVWDPDRITIIDTIFPSADSDSDSDSDSDRDYQYYYDPDPGPGPGPGLGPDPDPDPDPVPDYDPDPDYDYYYDLYPGPGPDPGPGPGPDPGSDPVPDYDPDPDYDYYYDLYPGPGPDPCPGPDP